MSDGSEWTWERQRPFMGEWCVVTFEREGTVHVRTMMPRHPTPIGTRFTDRDTGMEWFIPQDELRSLEALGEPYMTSGRTSTCPECRRVFDQSNPVDVQELAYGHDCEA